MMHCDCFKPTVFGATGTNSQGETLHTNTTQAVESEEGLGVKRDMVDSQISCSASPTPDHF